MRALGGGRRLPVWEFQDMLLANLEELAAAAAIITAAMVLGRLLYRTSRSNPQSILVNSGMVADLLCVLEVCLIVSGPMLMLRVLFNFF